MTLESPPSSSTSVVETQAIEEIAAILVEHADEAIAAEEPRQ